MNKEKIDGQKIQLLGGALVIVERWSNTGRCCKCDQPIIWARTVKNNKLIPIERVAGDDYRAHFASCPYAKLFRKKTCH